MDQRKLLARILSKTQPQENGCINWTGSVRISKGKYKYGQLFYDGKPISAHRFFFKRAHGYLPTVLEIDHICRNSICVNPDHLRTVTHQQNCNNRSTSNRTHCKRGHELSGDNLRVSNLGRRICKACINQNVRKWAKLYPDRYKAISRKSYYKLRNKLFDTSNGQFDGGKMPAEVNVDAEISEKKSASFDLTTD